DPADTRILFANSRHHGKTLAEVPVSYLDWLAGQDWLDPDSFLGRMLRLCLGRLAAGALQHLAEEPYDTRGFSPTERLPGPHLLPVRVGEGPWRAGRLHPPWLLKEVVLRRKPSAWYQRRPPCQTWADDEATNQHWWALGSQQLLWPAGLRLP